MTEWIDPQEHADRARDYYLVGRWDDALSELERALSLNPDVCDWHLGMGLTLDAMQRYDEAIDCYTQAVRLRNDDVDALMYLGIDLLRLNRPAEAIEVLAESNRVDPDFEPGYCYRILAYADVGDHDQAELMFYLAQQVHDECPRCFDHLAQSLLERGETERAAFCWSRTLLRDPEHPTVRARLGQLHWRGGRLETASDYFRQQAKLFPEDVETQLALAQIALDLGRHAEATDVCQRVLDHEPNRAEAHLHLGEAALQRGDLRDAALQLDTAACLDPTLAGVNLRLAQIARRRGQQQEARILLFRELDRPDHNPLEAVELARTLTDVGMSDDAIGLLTRLLIEHDFAETWSDGDPHAAELLHALDADLRAAVLLHRGYAYLVSGRLRQGVADCRQAVRLAPTNVTALHNLALAYLAAGELRKSGYFHRRAARLDRRHRGVRRLGWSIRREKLVSLWRMLTAAIARN